VFDIVRVCDATYATKQLEDNGITVLVTDQNSMDNFLTTKLLQMESPRRV